MSCDRVCGDPATGCCEVIFAAKYVFEWSPSVTMSLHSEWESSGASPATTRYLSWLVRNHEGERRT